MLLRCFLLHIGPRKEVVLLVSGNQPGENFLSLTRLQRRMCITIYIFVFKKEQINNKQTRIKKKQKKLMKKREYLWKIDQKKKKNCGRSREDFSCHPHFLKQEKTIWLVFQNHFHFHYDKSFNLTKFKHICFYAHF